MTSVKELGKSLKKRHGDPEPDTEGEGPQISPLPTSGAYSALLVIGGCVALGVGAFLASSLVIAPELAWIADSLTRMGITSGAVLAGGVTLLGLGLVCKAIARTHRSLAGDMRNGSEMSAVTDSQEELRDGLDKVQFELRVLHESTRQLLEIAHEQTLKRTNHPDDAVLQLAASLDQLGARLEDRLETQHTGLEQRLGSLDGALEDTRRRITRWAESLERSQAAGSTEASRTPRSMETDGQRTNKPRRRKQGKENVVAENKRPEGKRKASSVEDELHVLVTLDDQENDNGSTYKTEDALMAATSLGLLDQIGDFRELSREEGETPDVDGEGTPDEAKLEQLKSLLADKDLRKALEDLRREDGGGQ